MKKINFNKKVLITAGISIIVVAALVVVALQTVLPITTNEPEEITQTSPSGQIAEVNVPTTETATEQPTSSSTSLTILSIVGGDVFIMHAGTSNWIPAAVGTTLQVGDVIKTGDDSNAEVTFFEGSTIELTVKTIISFADLGISDTGSTTIDLKQKLGKTISRVKKLADQESSYEIETPAAIAAVRGSTMVVTVLEDGTTIVANYGGDIRVIAQGVEVVIPEGMQCIIVPGGVPSAPIPIDPSLPSPIPPNGNGEIPLVASIYATVHPNSLEVYVDETITYTYSIYNTGNIGILSVSISDDVAGVPIYKSGDTNANSFFDSWEIWVYTATHIASAEDPALLINTATFSATVNATSTLVAKETAQVSIITKPLSIQTELLSDGEVGAEYSQTLIAVNGAPPYTWHISGGALPDGLELDAGTGNLIGTPNTTGLSTFTIQVSDSKNNTATKDFTIKVYELLTIETEYLPSGSVNAPYVQTLVAVNGALPYSWSIIKGTLPEGLALDSETGNITGVPTTAGVWKFTVRVTDNLGVTVTKELTITIQ